VTTWLTRLAPIVLGIVGLIFLVSGVFSLLNQGRTPVTGTVGTCTTRVSHSANNSHTTAYTCDVTWQAAGQTRTTSINLGAGPFHAGQSVALRVHGGTVAVATPWWVGAGETALGGVLVLVAAILVVRRRRPAAGPPGNVRA